MHKNLPWTHGNLLFVGVIATGCGQGISLVPLQPPNSSETIPDTASPLEDVAPATLEEMPLPPGRTLWSWDIVGEASLVDPGSADAIWIGSVTWAWRDESTGAEACVAELDTIGSGQDDDCTIGTGCLFGMNVEHTLVTFDGPDGCWDKLGLPDADGPLDQWGLGYADAWSEDGESPDHPVLYRWSRDSKTFPGAWRPMGVATWDEEAEVFSYTFDTLWFFIVEG